jgi:hypothetical protein
MLIRQAMLRNSYHLGGRGCAGLAFLIHPYKMYCTCWHQDGQKVELHGSSICTSQVILFFHVFSVQNLPPFRSPVADKPEVPIVGLLERTQL